MKLRAKRGLAVCALLATLAAAQEPTTESPHATVAALHSGLIAAAGSGAVEERYRVLRPLIAATHDLPYIAEFALRRQWPSLSPEDRQRFIAAFEELSVMTYASRFGGASDGLFRIIDIAQADAGRAEVNASIEPAGAAAVPLTYLLHERDGAWKIINIVADGVSDLALKRAEYQRVLASGTLDDLIAELREQTARLR